MIYDASGEMIGRYNDSTSSWETAPFRMGHRMLGTYDFGSNVTHFLHADALGSGTVITDGTGSVVNEQLFYPWGTLWEDTSQSEFHFAAFDWGYATPGILPTPNRMYSYGKGRWMTPDPSGLAAADPTNPESLNGYAYALNSPTGLVDPSGLNAADPDSLAVCNGGEDTAGYPCTTVDAGDGGGVFTIFLPVWGGGGGGGARGSGSSASGGGATGSGSPPFNEKPPVNINGQLTPWQLLWPDSWGQMPCEFGPCGPTTDTGFIGAVPDASDVAWAVPYLIRITAWGWPIIEAGAATVAADAAALGAAIPYVLMQKGDASPIPFGSRFPTIQELQTFCTPVGGPIIEPSTSQPGTSEEQEYDCRGVTYTIHCLVSPTGASRKCHVRPGPPKGGRGQP
jgi:RHS repeat-associated protein